MPLVRRGAERRAQLLLDGLLDCPADGLVDQLAERDLMTSYETQVPGTFLHGRIPPVRPGVVPGVLNTRENAPSSISTRIGDTPAGIDPYYSDDQWRSRGTQFVDVNGDGRVDFVLAKGTSRMTWENNGHGWKQRPEWALPAALVNSDGFHIGTLLADVNGDGMPDLVNSASPSAYCANQQICVWINHIKDNPNCTASTCWEADSTLGAVPATFRHTEPLSGNLGNVDFTKLYSLADMNGDGRPDLVRTGPGDVDLQVLLNTPTGWAAPPPSQNFSWDSSLGGPILGGAFRDVNRDGLTDFAGAINLGFNGGTNGTVWAPQQYPDPNWSEWNAPKSGLLQGDVDGDGLHDSVLYFYHNQPGTSLVRNVSFATGAAFSVSDSLGYLPGYAAALDQYIPPPVPYSIPPVTDVPDPGLTQNYAFAMADINGDGLADFILNHADGGEVLVNTGSTWKDLHGFPQWTPSTGINHVPVVPMEQFDDGFRTVANGQAVVNGGAFVDLDGDGITDLVQSSDATGVHRSWLNKFRPALIMKFPDGLARKSEVTYTVITTEQAQSGGASAIYTDDSNPPVPGTARFIMPLRVVSSILAENGSAAGPMFRTNYQYSSLRASTTGRGPQGFRSITQIDERTNIGTFTTYAQAYPYTGLPLVVIKRLGTDFVISATETKYCDAFGQSGADPQCTEETGATYPPKRRCSSIR